VDFHPKKLQQFHLFSFQLFNSKGASDEKNFDSFHLFSFDLFFGSSFATTNPISFDFFSHRLIICLNSAGNEERKDGAKKN